MKKGVFGREYDPDTKATFHADRQDRMVDDAERYLQYLPEQVRNMAATRELTDAAVTARYLATDPRAQTAALVGGLGTVGIGGTAAALQAYNDQQVDHLPTGPLSVAGRMASNLNPFKSDAVGIDSLAEARNKIADARQIVGTENMLEALAADEIVQLRGEQEMAMTPADYQQAVAVQSMIDRRTEQLMGQPIQRSDGSVAPMPFDTAQRLATEQVHMELRAEGAY